jgi:dipeptidyl aminopeptidase/acylaminoacyl peptidase
MSTLLLLLATIHAAPVPMSEDQDRITVWLGDALVSMRPNGKDLNKKQVPPFNRSNAYNLRLCGDCNTLIYYQKVTVGLDNVDWLVVYSLDKGEAIEEFKDRAPCSFKAAPDAGRCYFTIMKAKGEKPSRDAPKESWSYDVATKKRTKLPLSDQMSVSAVSASGKSFLVSGPEQNGNNWEWHYHLVVEEGNKSVPLFAGINLVANSSFSPNGDRLLAEVTNYESVEVNRIATIPGRLLSRKTAVIDLATMNETKLPKPPIGDEYDQIVWSPDGKKIAFSCSDSPPGASAVKLHREYRLFVANPDGSNAIEIHKSETNYRAIVWR